MNQADYIAMNEVTTQLRDLPVRIHGFTYHDDEGRYIVVINSRLGFMMNRNTMDHELMHIMRDDCSNPDYREYE